jgi:hypothetical protein
MSISSRDSRECRETPSPRPSGRSHTKESKPGGSGLHQPGGPDSPDTQNEGTGQSRPNIDGPVPILPSLPTLERGSVMLAQRCAGSQVTHMQAPELIRLDQDHSPAVSWKCRGGTPLWADERKRSSER